MGSVKSANKRSLGFDIAPSTYSSAEEVWTAVAVRNIANGIKKHSDFKMIRKEWIVLCGWQNAIITYFLFRLDE